MVNDKDLSPGIKKKTKINAYKEVMKKIYKKYDKKKESGYFYSVDEMKDLVISWN